MSLLCAYPLSPSYSALPRLNTLLLLFAVLYGPRDNWATKGALAALMTRTAALSLHSFALLGVLENELRHSPPLSSVDLDILGTWAVLSVVAVAVPMMLSWAPSLMQSKARPLVRIWGVLVAAGAICAYVGMHRIKTLTASAPDCALMAKLPMRRTGNPLEISWDELFLQPPAQQAMRAWDIAALVVVAFGIWACFKPGRVGAKSPSTWDGAPGNSQIQVPTFDNSVFSPGIFAFEAVFLTLGVLVFYGIVILHEIWLWKANVPVLEGLDGFEQWNSWVATGLVIIATVLNWMLGLKSETKSSQDVTIHAADLETGDVDFMTKAAVH